MKFSFTAEQEEFRGVLRRYFEETSPSGVVRRLMETQAGWDREDWGRLNTRLGLAGVYIPEEYGGQGFGWVELGIVLEEMGRALVCAPYFASSVLAATAILNGGSAGQKEALLPPIALGEAIATLAFTEPNGRWDAGGIETTATRLENGRYRLDGEKSFVLDGHTADLLVVAARTPGSAGEDGLSLFKVAQPKDWSAIEKAFTDKTAVVGTVTELRKGGFSVDIGTRAFMPASRSGVREAAEVNGLVFEGSAATPFAAIVRRLVDDDESRIGFIASGRNIAHGLLVELLSEALD